MVHFRGGARVFLVAAALASVAIAGSRSARADEGGASPCLPITGTVQTQQATGACPSPVGICFTGTLATTSALRGDTFFVVTSVTPSPTDPTVLLYTGTLTVTLANGAVVTFQTTGSVNQVTGQFVELDRASSPIDATLTMSGTTNATLSAFNGTVSGQLCTVDIARP